MEIRRIPVIKFLACLENGSVVILRLEGGGGGKDGSTKVENSVGNIRLERKYG